MAALLERNASGMLCPVRKMLTMHLHYFVPLLLMASCEYSCAGKQCCTLCDQCSDFMKVTIRRMEYMKDTCSTDYSTNRSLAVCCYVAVRCYVASYKGAFTNVFATGYIIMTFASDPLHPKCQTESQDIWTSGKLLYTICLQ